MPTGIPVVYAQSCLCCVSIWWRVGWSVGECLFLGAENGFYSLASCAARGAWGLCRLSGREQHPPLSRDLQAWWVLLGCPHGTCGWFGSRLVEGRKGELALAFRWCWSAPHGLTALAAAGSFCRACLPVPPLCELGHTWPGTTWKWN